MGRAASEAIVHAAMEAGANLFDTAAMYNGGASEEVLGQALKGKRDKALISTKFGPHQAYPQTIRKALEESLKTPCAGKERSRPSASATSARSK